jgi:suppressor of ftsI
MSARSPLHPALLPRRTGMRAQLLRTGLAALAAAGVLYACDQSSPAAPSEPEQAMQPVGTLTDPGFPQPPTLRSSGGRLDVTLTAAPATVQIAGREVRSTVFNGMYIPPTLRVRRGELLRITLVNASDMNTNLHGHGLEVSPKGISDNIFRRARPGGSLIYEFHIPNDHPAGMFWYHPHYHGNASAQTKFGMAGMIIVEGLQDEVPALRGLPERMLVLRDAQIAGGTVDTASEIGINTTRTVNGVVDPTITMAPGATELWRVGNNSANLYYRLVLDGHQLHLVGRDGNHLNRMLTLDEVLLPPGGRVELLVQPSPSEHAAFSLRTLAVQTGAAGDSYDGAVLATVRLQGAPVQPFALSSVTMPPLPDLRKQVTNNRGMVFGQSRDGEEFMVNGQHFDMNQINTRVRIGNVERWHIRNVTNEWHDFHIHQTQFQLVEEDGHPVPFDGYRDVVNVKEKSSITVIISFADPRTAGKYVYHCHILDHEDRGMMAVIQVGPLEERVAAADDELGMHHDGGHQ